MLIHKFTVRAASCILIMTALICVKVTLDISTPQSRPGRHDMVPVIEDTRLTMPPPVTTLSHRNKGPAFLEPKAKEEKQTLAPKNILHKQRILINEPHACVNASNIHLLVGVLSAPGEFHIRRAIRETWGREKVVDGANVVVLYFLGRPGSHMEHNVLKSESTFYGDIIQHDYTDAYNNLTHKSVALLEWVTTFCNMTKYVLKVDSDVYVTVGNMITYIKSQVHNRVSKDLVGRLSVDIKPYSDPSSKWYLPKYPEPVFPPYLTGPAYAMSVEAVFALYEACTQLAGPPLHIEDVFVTGLCARRAGVRPRHLANMYEDRLRAAVPLCRYKSIIGMHHVPPALMYTLHKQLLNTSITPC